MDRQPVICIQVIPGSLHIPCIHRGAELPGSVTDENVSEKCFLVPLSEQKYADGIAAHIDLFHIHVQPALPVPGLQLHKADVLSFGLSFVFINI